MDRETLEDAQGHDVCATYMSSQPDRPSRTIFGRLEQINDDASAFRVEPSSSLASHPFASWLRVRDLLSLEVF